jgi:hypothetical protein
MINLLILFLLPFTILAQGTPVGNPNGAILGVYAMCGTNPVDCKDGWCCVAGQQCLSSTSTAGSPLCMDSSVCAIPSAEPLADPKQKFRRHGQRRVLWHPPASPSGAECHVDHDWRVGRRHDYQRGAFISPDAALHGLNRRRDRRVPVALGLTGSFFGRNSWISRTALAHTGISLTVSLRWCNRGEGIGLIFIRRSAAWTGVV